MARKKGRRDAHESELATMVPGTLDERHDKVVRLMRDRMKLALDGRIDRREATLDEPELRDLLGWEKEDLADALALAVTRGDLVLDGELYSAPDDLSVPALARIERALEGAARGHRYLEHSLTDAELAEMREKREAHDEVGDDIDRDCSRLEKELKGRRKALEVEREESLRLSRIIRAGHEPREVECAEVRLPSDTAIVWDDPLTVEPSGSRRDIMVTIRCDSLAGIEWRELRESERQGTLFDEPKVGDA